jgi:hypothetical protein
MDTGNPAARIWWAITWSSILKLVEKTTCPGNREVIRASASPMDNPSISPLIEWSNWVADEVVSI